MLRSMAIAATTSLLIIATCLAQEPKSETKATPPPPKKVATPNTGRSAQPGDEAEIYDASTPAGTEKTYLGQLIISKKANDQVGIDRLKEMRRAYLLPSGTKVLVIQLHLRKVDMTPSSSESYASDLQAGASGLATDRPVESVQVRILDGPFKDMALYVPVDSIALMKLPPPPSPQAKPKPPEKVATAESRAASLLSAGKNLEKAGKPKAALENYRKIAADFAETPSAKEAGERIKALGGK